MLLDVNQRLVAYLEPYAEAFVATDVRIGLGYTAVQLNNGRVGLAATPDTRSLCCTHVRSAGTLTGSPARELLSMLIDPMQDIARAVGLATANALLSTLPHPEGIPGEALSLLEVRKTDRVAMVGYFRPVAAALRERGCVLDIIELKPEEYPETISPEAGRESLALCDVAIITGTCFINGTCDGVLAQLHRPRTVVILGPSTPLCPPIFRGTPVTQVSGAWVRDPDKTLLVVSEGGGTQAFKNLLDFITIPVQAGLG